MGGEAEIQGHRPDWYVKYSETVDHQTRIKTVVDWLKLPEDQRPHFITLYFSEVDTAGHQFGPESKEVAEAVSKVDQSLGILRNEIKTLGLPINLIVVSDHGMESVEPDKAVYLDEKIDLKSFKNIGSGTMMMLHLKPNENPKVIEETVRKLNKLSPYLTARKRSDFVKEHFSGDPRAGEIIISMKSPWMVFVDHKKPLSRGGSHGWSPQENKNMHGIFFAEGPQLQKGKLIPSFENVDVFPLVAKIMNWKNLPKVSGRIDSVQGAIKN